MLHSISRIRNRVKGHGIFSIFRLLKWRFLTRYRTIIVEDHDLSLAILAKNQVSPSKVLHTKLHLSHTSNFAETKTISNDYRQKEALYLKDVTVWARFGIAADTGFRIIAETAFCESRLLELNGSKQLRNFPIVRLNTPFAVFGQGWENYYHWLIDDMSSLPWLKDELDRIDGLVTLVVAGNLNNEQFEILSRAVSSNVVIRRIDPDTRITGPVYISVPSAANSEMAYLPPKVIADIVKILIPEEITTNEELDSPPRLYISRRNAEKRRVMNEDELIQNISKFGFKTVHLEDMTVVAQARLFAGAKMIIGQHGAGFSNLIFGDGRCKVLEIHSHLEHHHYRWLAKSKDIGYSSILVNNESYNSDIVVPIDQVCEWIKSCNEFSE